MRVALAWVDLDDPTDRCVAVNLARELRRAGHQVWLVGPRRRTGEAPREIHSGAPVRRVGWPALGSWPWLSDAVAAWQLLAFHRRERVELWHCHVFARSHRALAWAARLGGWRLLASLHLVLEDYLPAVGGREGLRRLLRQSYHVTAVCGSGREAAVGLLPELGPRSSVVPNGGPAPGPEPEREASPPFILSVARLAPYKGQDLLLMAFAAVADELPELRLTLCGRDQTRGGAAGLARRLGLEGRVTFAGQRTPAEVGALMRDCLFFVLPSRRENFPLALLEAMAAGKAVAAARVGAVPEIVRDGVDGLLVAPNDVGALAGALRTLARDPAQRGRLGRSARQRSGGYTWSRAAAGYQELYAQAR